MAYVPRSPNYVMDDRELVMNFTDQNMGYPANIDWSDHGLCKDQMTPRSDRGEKEKRRISFNNPDPLTTLISSIRKGKDVK